ncbi:MAG: amidohydrolase family protein [Pirellulales bacterium]|nr:amidohydrolase family protein [Pirellulales bacterium]
MPVPRCPSACGRSLVLLALLQLVHGIANAAEPSTTPPSGLRKNTPAVHFLEGTRVVIAPGRVLEKANVLVRDGVIAAVGEDLSAPADARVWPLAGKTIYPGFIDAYSELTTTSPTPGGAPYWNTNVVPQNRAEKIYQADKAYNKKLRSQGITSRLIVPTGGIIRGTSAVVSTADEAASRDTIRDQVALHLQLTVRRGSRDSYPNSPMGAVALVRQALYDADWYRKAWSAFATREGLPRPEQNDALEVLEKHLHEGLPVIIDTSNERYFFRADRLGSEFGLNVIVRGSGREYRRLDAVAASGRTLIVPVNFPKAPNVRTPDAALEASLEELLEWDLAPENPARLEKAGVRIALTAHGLKDSSTFLSRVREAVRRGLPAEAALRALTTTPASILGIGGRHGTIEPGRSADLVIADGDLFADKGRVLETWVAGTRYEVEAEPLFDLRGTWAAKITQPDGSEKTATVHVAGEPRKLEGSLDVGGAKLKLGHVSLSDAQWTFTFSAKEFSGEGTARAATTIALAETSEMTALGVVEWPNGSSDPFTATRTKSFDPQAAADKDSKATDEPSGQESGAGDEPAEPVVRPADEPPTEETVMPPDAAKGDAPGTAETTKPEGEKPAKRATDTDKQQPVKEDKNQPRQALFPVNYPLGAFGVAGPPEQPALVAFTGATVWTSGLEGKLDHATVLVEAGRIKAVGKDVQVPEEALVIDCQGRHITPGLIDCHSHIATDGGINESSQAITAEVRIGDFIDADDVNIYRQLAGGVTSSNILHGSANPIGGQNQVIKLRWGAMPEEIKFAGAPLGIKFALGENVKQANWGDRFNSRYPQSRMGVEQIMRDAFLAAQDYRRAWDQWQRTQAGLPPRFDLELEAIAEILAGDRLIHCHSYRQDEILALIRTCEEFGIRIATLQHILEGYKVADALAKHGAGGSSFSDWWAYKIEVYDSIPYNGALLHNAGVVVSFNSDDAELARRLNLEAAKALHYGRVPEIEALKFVTLNPAKQLRIDQRVGSLEPGKDADLVVWSESPLSTYTRCEQTWIDGRKYFDREADIARRIELRDMRAQLVQRILKSGADMRGPGESRGGEDDFWPREDLFCGHHDHGHDGGHQQADHEHAQHGSEE